MVPVPGGGGLLPSSSRISRVFISSSFIFQGRAKTSCPSVTGVGQVSPNYSLAAAPGSRCCHCPYWCLGRQSPAQPRPRLWGTAPEFTPRFWAALLGLYRCRDSNIKRLHERLQSIPAENKKQVLCFSHPSRKLKQKEAYCLSPKTSLRHWRHKEMTVPRQMYQLWQLR